MARVSTGRPQTRGAGVQRRHGKTQPPPLFPRRLVFISEGPDRTDGEGSEGRGDPPTHPPPTANTTTTTPAASDAAKGHFARGPPSDSGRRGRGKRLTAAGARRNPLTSASGRHASDGVPALNDRPRHLEPSGPGHPSPLHHPRSSPDRTLRRPGQLQFLVFQISAAWFRRARQRFSQALTDRATGSASSLVEKRHWRASSPASSLGRGGLEECESMTTACRRS